MVAGSSPEECPKAVKLLFGYPLLERIAPRHEYRVNAYMVGALHTLSLEAGCFMETWDVSLPGR